MTIRQLAHYHRGDKSKLKCKQLIAQNSNKREIRSCAGGNRNIRGRLVLLLTEERIDDDDDDDDKIVMVIMMIMMVIVMIWWWWWW